MGQGTGVYTLLAGFGGKAAGWSAGRPRREVRVEVGARGEFGEVGWWEGERSGRGRLDCHSEGEAMARSFAARVHMSKSIKK